jgi:hypothetical protein
MATPFFGSGFFTPDPLFRQRLVSDLMLRIADLRILRLARLRVECLSRIEICGVTDLATHRREMSIRKGNL